MCLYNLIIIIFFKFTYLNENHFANYMYEYVKFRILKYINIHGLHLNTLVVLINLLFIQQTLSLFKVLKVY